MYDAGLPCQPLPHFPARRVWNHRFSQLYSAGTRSFSGATAHCLLINSAYGGLIPLSWDAPQAAALIEGLPAEVVIADTAYDADHLRKDICRQKSVRVGGTVLLGGLSTFGAATLVLGVDLGFEAAALAAFVANVFMIDGLARDIVRR